MALLLALAVLPLVLGVTAGPALAHANLESTSPTVSGQVDASPGKVSLRFSEAIGLAPDSIRVVDPTGARVDLGDVAHDGSDAATAVVSLPPDLPRASYAVFWHVVSADSHPVAGAFSFGVGVPAGSAPGLSPADPAVSRAHWAALVLWYTGACLLIGPVVFLCVLWPAGWSNRRVRRLLAGGGILAGAATAALYLIQGPYGQSQGLSGLTDLSLLRSTFDTPTGPLLLGRLALVAILGAVALPAALRPAPAEPTAEPNDRGGPAPAPPVTPTPARRRTAGGLAVLVGLTAAAGGHAGREAPAAPNVVADAAHLLAAATWLGGLVLLGAVVLGRSPHDDLRGLLPRWSRLATGCVAVLVASGLYQAWRETRGLGPLTGTSYGRFVLAKAAGLVVLLALAAVGRWWVAGHAAGRPRIMGHLRASVAAEAGAGAVVLALTASLVSGVPARLDWSPPFATSVTALSLSQATVRVEITSPSTRVGAEEIHIATFTSDGRVQPFVTAEVSLTELGRHLGPVTATVAYQGPGRGTASGLIVPVAGDWTLTVKVNTSLTTVFTASTSYPVPAR